MKRLKHTDEEAPYTDESGAVVDSGYTSEDDGEENENRKKKRGLYIARIVTFILAIVIWLYVRTSSNVPVEQTFDLIPVDVRGVATMQEKGLDVYSMSFSHVNVTLKGTHNVLSRVEVDSIDAYVDLSDIEEPGEYELSVKYQIPSGLALVNQSQKLTVTVDKTESRFFAVTSSGIYAESFSIADSCKMDLDNAKANINYIKVTAPTLILSEIESVRLVANATITLTSSSDVSATVQFLDKDGRPIVNDSIRSVAYYGGLLNEENVLVGGVPRDLITVNIPLIKEKEVPVRFVDSEGILTDSEITLSPATVVIKGSPDAVDAIDSWVIGSFSAKNLVQENGSTVVKSTVTPTALPENITEVVVGKKTYSDTLPAFSAEVKVGGTYSLTVPKSSITLVGGNADGVEIVEESLEIILRTVGDETYFLLLENSINAGNGGISLVVNLSDVVWDPTQNTASVSVTVIFSSDFEGKVYEVWDVPYRVTVTQIG